MQKSTLKDFNSLLALFRDNNVKDAFDKLYYNGQVSERGLDFSTIDSDTGFDIHYDVYLVYDCQDNSVPVDESFYRKLSECQKKELNNCLVSVLIRSKEFTWSRGQTSLMTVKPTVIGIEGLVGIVIFMTANGPDDTAPQKSYTFFEVNDERNRP